MEIIQKLAHRTNYGSMRDTKSIKYIVIHYTANDGDSAWGNASYFQNNPNLKASAHYFVDDTKIYQSVPNNYTAYSVGSKTVDVSLGGGKYYNKCTNANSISIELCDTEKNGSLYPTQATIDTAIELTKRLMEEFHISKDNVIRHFDVTGKLCPAYWTKDKYWENEFHSKLCQPVGWIKDNVGWWYRYEDGNYPRQEWKEIDGKWYYFKSDGYMASDEFIKSKDYVTNQKLYYVNKDGDWDNKSYRWIEDAKGWWLAIIGGSWYAQNEWAKVDGAWYYFDEDGYMIRNRIKSINGRICQFGSDGALK